MESTDLRIAHVTEPTRSFVLMYVAWEDTQSPLGPFLLEALGRRVFPSKGVVLMAMDPTGRLQFSGTDAELVDMSRRLINPEALPWETVTVQIGA